MLHYRTITNKQSDSWVVMIHGAGGSIEVWYRQVAEELHTRIKALFNEYISIPTLYLMGEDDKLFLPEVQQTVKDSGDNVSLVIVPNAGHVCNVDNKSFFNQESLNFLCSI